MWGYLVQVWALEQHSPGAKVNGWAFPASGLAVNACKCSLDWVDPFYIWLTVYQYKVSSFPEVNYLRLGTPFWGTIPENVCTTRHLDQSNLGYVNLNVTLVYTL